MLTEISIRQAAELLAQDGFGECNCLDDTRNCNYCKEYWRVVNVLEAPLLEKQLREEAKEEIESNSNILKSMPSLPEKGGCDG